MKKRQKIDLSTKLFNAALKRLDEQGKLPTNGELKDLLDINSVSTISEIKGERQNIQPSSWEKFKSEYSELVSELEKENRLHDDDQHQKNHTAEPVPGYATMDFKEKYYNLLETHDKRFAALEVTIIRLTEMLESERTKRPTADTIDKLQQAGV